MSIDIVKTSLWEQFGASIDMLRNAIVMWPQDTWETKPKAFRMAFHTLFFLEYYMTNPPDDFYPMLSITETEDEFAPSRIYSKEEILGYLDACKSKCKEVIDSFTEANIDQVWLMKKWNRSFNFYELMIYNMRHVQHHAAQMNMMLRSEINDSPDWVSRTSNAEA